ncbi:HNH endonuclease signature motif containing protein [Mycobacterium sp. smrl_JER01]|uniref:HNH endonuclease signature motif containing protein n=1 Tax=Mycobacterium sp. smrl_JER01 TaxID=3402633 RepID=UPI003AC07029
MDMVSEALGVVADQLAIVSKAADELSHRELVKLLSALTTLQRGAPALEHKILARLIGETQPYRLGEPTWKKVLTTTLRCSGADAEQRLKRAKTLGPRRSMTGEPLAPLWESTAAAQARGDLSDEHVTVIAQFHKKLPSWVDPDTRAHADRHLADIGAGLDPHNLDEAAGMLLLMINPDGDPPEDRQPERHRGIRISRQRPDGTATISGTLTPEAIAVWQAIFASAAAPGHSPPARNQRGEHRQRDDIERLDPAPAADHDPPAEQHGQDTRTCAQRNHDAFLTLGRRALESGELGNHNGLPTTVIVTTTLQELEKAAGVAVTGGGSLLPMPDLIRMAARAHHYLYVYDQHSGQSLYLGRTKRLANTAQRIVLHARDRGCTRPGCSAPGYWCQVHHAVSDWVHNGQTNIDELTFVCPADHRMLDKTDWTTTRNTKNHTEWHPPPHLDTGQHRINGYHHPERYLLPEDDQGP